ITFASEILFNVSQIEEFLFAKILILLIIFFITYVVLKKNNFLGSDKRIVFVVSLAISLLAVRFIPDNEFMNGILLPYGALGIGITIFLPLIIYFFFTHQANLGTFGRRATWIIFLIVFLALWGMRYSEIDPTGNWIYTVGLIFVIVALIFDKSIHKYFGLSNFRKAHKRVEMERKWKLQDKADELAERLQKGQISAGFYDREIKRIRDAIKELSSN
ncbi:MAG: hypothetical protein ACP5D2_05065, partial [Candidatus Nanoarchaeia archaeon]